MKAQDTAYEYATPNINHLQRGETYKATTPARTVVGEYLGIESPHGDRAILLRHCTGTESLELSRVTSIQLMAA